MILAALFLVLGAAGNGVAGRTDDGRVPSVRIRRVDREFDSVYRRRVAICIGANEYDSYPKLNCAAWDAVEMAGVFEAHGFDEVILLTDEEAHKDAILKALARVTEQGHEDDLVVFFYAGHGATIRTKDDGTMGFLVPINCRRGHEEEDGISLGALTQMAKAMPHRHTLFLMDACYSGLGLSNARRVAKTTSKRSKKRREKDVLARARERSVQVLTAGGSMDKAFEADGHGLFTRQVLNCLRGLSPESKDGIVSGREIAMRVKSKVKSETGGWQNPQFGSQGAGDVVFTLGRRTTPLASSVAMAVQP
jgi:uncharacterized caspase-like protein